MDTPQVILDYRTKCETVINTLIELKALMGTPEFECAFMMGNDGDFDVSDVYGAFEFLVGDLKEAI